MRVDGRSGRLIRFSGGMRRLKQRSLPLPRSEWTVLAMIDAEWLRETCLALCGTTEQIQWGCDLVFKVGEKMYAVAPMEPAPVCLSFKCSDDSFAELTARSHKSSLLGEPNARRVRARNPAAERDAAELVILQADPHGESIYHAAPL